MPRRLLLLNMLLGAIAIGSAGFIAGELVSPSPAPPLLRPRSAAPTVPAPVPEAPRPPASAYDVIATQNLFSPKRAEEPAMVATGPAAPAVPKPNLYGVLLRDQNPIAYLEDPQTKRVASYQIGDAIAGGTLQTITADRVVIARPDGPIDVRLRDPSTPRTAAAAAPVGPAASIPNASEGAAPGVSPHETTAAVTPVASGASIPNASEGAAPSVSPHEATEDPSAGMFRHQMPVQPILNGGD